MSSLISKCPVCNGDLKIASLSCPDCGLELRNQFEFSPFDTLTEQQREFLLAFLRRKGNLSAVQSQLGISYPLAKKRLGDLLSALGLAEDETDLFERKDEIEMYHWNTDKNSARASDVVRNKLIEDGGRVTVYTLQGLPCDVRIAADGQSFISDKLPISPAYRFDVFDLIVDTINAQGGRARKGNGRNYKLGESECDETTIVGAIAYDYAGKETGSSVFDPVFVLAAILDWAGVVKNERGYLELTPEYRVRIAQGK